MNILIISGTPRKNGLSIRVAKHLKTTLEASTKHTVKIVDIRDYPLSSFEEVYPTVEAAPEAFKEVTSTYYAADAYILVSPEYNGSFPGTLKNFLDLFPYFNAPSHKAYGIATTSVGGLGGIRAGRLLQNYVNDTFSILSPQMLVTSQVDKKFDEDGKLLDDGFKGAIDTFLKEFLWLAEKLKS